MNVNRCKWGLLPGMLMLTACGGSGDSDPGSHTTTSPPPGPPPVYTDYEAASAALHSTWDIVAFTDPSTLPVSGGADYEGVLRMDLQNTGGDISVDGRLQMHADFASSTVSGGADRFVDENEIVYSGSLTLSNGLIDRGADPSVDYTFSADLDGTVSGAGETYGIAADFSGDFQSSTYGAIVGAVTGTATSSFGVGYAFGDFIGER